MFQRGDLFGQLAFLDDEAFPRVQGFNGLADPGLAPLTVMAVHDLDFRRAALIDQHVLPLHVAFFAHGRIEGTVHRTQARGHAVDIHFADLEFLGNMLAVFRVDRGPVDIPDLGPQAAQIEEKRLLGGGCPGPHDRPVAQDIVLDGGADPPAGIGRKADIAARFEPVGRLHQPDIAFLDQVGEGQAVALVAGGQGNHETDMGFGQPVQRMVVALLAPEARQFLFFLTLQQGLGHGGFDETLFSGGARRTDGGYG